MGLGSESGTLKNRNRTDVGASIRQDTISSISARL